MSASPTSKLHKQVVSVRRQLCLQILLDVLLLCWAGACLAAALALLVQPFLFGRVGPEARWTLVGGAVGAGTLCGLVLAWLRAPSRVAAALALDDRFGLKERVTTALLLSEEQAQSPAGQALLADTERHVQSLRTASRFPVRLSWSRALLSGGAVILAVLLALLFEPDLRGPTSAAAQGSNSPLARSKEGVEKITPLKKINAEEAIPEAEKSPELKKIEADLAKVEDESVDPSNEEQKREILKKIQNIEEKVQDRMDQLNAPKEKRAQVQEQLDQFKNLAPRDEPAKDGPAEEMLKALQEGDLQKAREEADKLKKELDEGKLDQKEQQQLKEQLEQLQPKEQQERLEELRQYKEKQLQKDEELKKQNKPGEFSKEQAQQLKNEVEQLKQMEEMAKQMGECKNCSKEGDSKKLGDALKKMSGNLEKLEGQKEKAKNEMKSLQKDLEKAAKEQQELAKHQQNLEQAREQVQQPPAAGQDQPADGDKGGGKKPGGLRRENKNGTDKFKDVRQNLEVDPTGRQKGMGTSWGAGSASTKVQASEVQSKFRKTEQATQRWIEEQPISREAQRFIKGYYQDPNSRPK